MNELVPIWTVVCIIVCACVITVTTAYVMYRFRNINVIRQNLEYSATQVIERAKQIEEEAKRLQQARLINEQLLTDLIYKENGNKELINHNKKILELNKDVLRKSNVEIFSAKEAIIYLHNHYARLIKIIDDVLQAEDEWVREQLYALRDTAQHNLAMHSNQFINNFGKSVEQYTAEKNQIVTKKPDGTSYITPFSKN